MTCASLVGASPRISARSGRVVDLNVLFTNNGVPTDPFAVRHVEIYKTQVLPHNLMATIPVVKPSDVLYPAPLCYGTTPGVDGHCGTEAVGSVRAVGEFNLPYLVPTDFPVPDVYYDVWYYFPTNPCGQFGTGTELDECDIDNPEYNSLLLKCCHRFWIYPDDWYCNDKLQTIRFGFEPLDQRFYSPEVRPLEVGLMPLPLYDYNFNLVNPMIPFLKPTITITTHYNEVLFSDVACRIGIRQGSYRSNPWVVQYDLDTTKFLKGTYQYSIKLELPDGSTRVSRKFIFMIA